ncbi:unnamed protein product [Didymodactylos carnosus]|uniref:Uncharacterized protein n=1 Tax=Didymodactylos carnosus TaxID=1234261 RepID=A0A813X0Z1_9BILA|nr:unnamed protein product [Didymodactylos carnosus]CAF3646324.1 unnamed protein product [Didymodactylos carnosus]
MSYLRYNSSRFVRQTPSRTPCLQLTLEPWPYPTLQGRVGWADDTFVCLRSINMERPISDMDRLPYAKYTEMRKRLETEKLADTEVDKLYDIVQVTAGLFDKNAIRYTIEGGPSQQRRDNDDDDGKRYKRQEADSQKSVISR